jgi:hypothetical protein
MSKITDFFKGDPSPEELEARDERLSTELSIAKKRALIAELNKREKDWRDFSKDGTKAGISWEKIMAWFRSSK